MKKALHCWQGENDENEIGSDEWMDVFVRGEGTCLLPDGHDGPHVFAPGDEVIICFGSGTGE